MTSNERHDTLPDAAEDRFSQLAVLDFFHDLQDRKGLAISIVVFCILLGGAYAFLTTPVYTSDLLVKVEQSKASALGALQSVIGSLDAATDETAGEIDIIKSRTIVGAAVTVTHADIIAEPKSYFPIIGRFYARRHDSDTALQPPFLGLSSFAWGGERLGVDRFEVPQFAYEQEFTLTADGDHWTLTNDDDQKIGEGRVGAEQKLQFQDRFGRVATGSLLVSKLIARSGATFTLVKRSPQGIFRDISNDLDAVETSRESSVIRVTFNDPNPIFASNFLNALGAAYTKSNVASRSAESRLSLEFLKSQLPDIQHRLEVSESALNDYRRTTNSIDIAQETQSLLVQSSTIKQQLLQADLARRNLLARFGPDHPQVRALAAQIAILSSQQTALDKQILGLPAAQQGYLRLAREVRVNTELYSSLMVNAQQLAVAQAGTTGNVSVVDPAVATDRPSKPKKPLVLLLAGVVGCLLAGLVVHFLARVRGAVKDPNDLERVSQKSIYAIIPESKEQEARFNLFKRGRRNIAGVLAVDHPTDPAVESLRGLRIGLQFAMQNATTNVVLITGPVPGVGKSFISANLSYVLATAGKKVLLVEADLRKPSLHRYFDGAKKIGLSSILTGAETFESAVLRQAVPGVDVLFAGPLYTNPSELLLTDRLSALLSKVKGDYDYVIVDTAPVLPVGDSIIVARHAGLVFVVARANVTSSLEVVESIRRMERTGSSVTGLVFNGFLQARYGYSAYRYGYSQDAQDV